MAWGNDTRLTDDLGCDSLALLHVGAAANEMFHLHEACDAADLLGDDRVGAWLDRIEAAWRAGVDRITFATSGSTGASRRCTHAMSHLRTETDVLAEMFSDRRRVVSFAPAHHIYGFLFGALLPDRLAIEVWPAERAGAAELTSGLRSGDVVIGFPERWQWLERSLPSWPADVVGTTSTGPCPPGLLEALAGRGLSRMVEIYGSSETAGLGVRSRPDAAFALMRQWQRDADSGPTALAHRSGLRMTMPDRIRWIDHRHFEVAGRTDGAVQVGGTNVYPAHVAARLRAYAGVADVHVRLMRPDEGQRLKAFVVPEPATDPLALESALTEWCAAALRPAERPTRFTFGSEPPTSALGKAADW